MQEQHKINKNIRITISLRMVITKTTTGIMSTLHGFFLESDLVKWSEHMSIGTEDYRLINPIARGEEEVELLSSELASRFWS